MKEIEDAVEMISEYHKGRHYLDESVRSVISSLYSLEAQLKANDECIAELQALQQPKSCKPENIIGRIKHSFSHATVVYTRGSCGQLYKILKEIFPDAEAYENDCHIITKIKHTFYDINGKVSQRLLQGFKPCQADNEMLSHRFGNDLQHIQCPHCDEVFYCGDEEIKNDFPWMKK